MIADTSVAPFRLYSHRVGTYHSHHRNTQKAVRRRRIAMRRKRIARLLRKLRAMRRSLPARDQLLMRLGAAKTDAGRAFAFVQIQIPAAGQAVTRESFRFSVEKTKLRDAELRDGHYLL